MLIGMVKSSCRSSWRQLQDSKVRSHHSVFRDEADTVTEMQLANAHGQRANSVTEAELLGEGKDEGLTNKQGRIPVERANGGT